MLCICTETSWTRCRRMSEAESTVGVSQIYAENVPLFDLSK